MMALCLGGTGVGFPRAPGFWPYQVEGTGQVIWLLLGHCFLYLYLRISGEENFFFGT